MSIKFRGNNFHFPILVIHDVPEAQLDQEITEKIKKAPELLKNTSVIIDVANIIQPNNWTKLHQTILKHGLHIIGVCCCQNNILKNKIIKSGLPILNEKHNPNKTLNKILMNTQMTTTKIIHTPIRSGQQIYAKNSDLIIINSVNYGAEIIADGNIHVYGLMKGRIFAGASGNEKCQIFCKNFAPELISINGRYWLNEKIPIKFIGQPVRINLQNGILSIHEL